MSPVNQKEKINLKDVLFSSGSSQIILRKLIDQTLGWILITFLSAIIKKRQKPIQLSTISKILIIRPGGIGDAVWVLPLVKILKQNIANCRIDILCEKRNADVFKFIEPSINAVILYDKKITSHLHIISRGDYNLVIDTEQYHNFSAIFSLLASKQYRIGFHTRSARSKIYSHTVSYSRQAKEYAMFLSLLKIIVPTTEEEYLHQSLITVSDKDNRWAKEFLIDKKPVALYIGASVKERSWGMEKFSTLCKHLIQQNQTVLIIGGKEDREVADKITQRQNSNRVFNFAGKSTLHQTAALLKCCRVTIGADSGIMHLSCVVGTPGIWLFGAGIEEKWLPPFPNQLSVNLRLACSPCTAFGYTPHCPYNIRCLSEISVEKVLSESKQFLV